MYRAVQLRVVAADDSNLRSVTFDRTLTAYQTRDLETAVAAVRVGTSDAQAQVSIAPLTTAYAVAVFSDYPIRVRFNGASETQFTMTPANVAAVNVGAPLPDQCAIYMQGQITSVWVQPISGATQTANVKIVATGDPSSAY